MTAALFWLVVGLSFLGLGLVLLRRSLVTRTWLTTSGVVEGADVVKVKAHRGFRFEARLTYRYQVLDRSLAGTVISRCGGPPSSLEPGGLKPFLDEHPVGADVTVHYDPANPDEACLEPGTTPATWILLLMGLVVTGRAVAALVAALRHA
jgi:hypothetical protein